MAACSYDRWDASFRPRKCITTATHIAKTPKERLFCGHHAAIAYALGWPVTPIGDAGIPEFEDERLTESEHA